MFKAGDKLLCIEYFPAVATGYASVPPEIWVVNGVDEDFPRACIQCGGKTRWVTLRTLSMYFEVLP